MPENALKVVVLYNHVGKDEFEALRQVDPDTLNFTPIYPIHVATIEEEYRAVVDALCAEGFQAGAVNLSNSLPRLHKILRDAPPDVVFNLVESFRGSQMLEFAVAGVYELYGIPFTGASAFALALCLRKGLTKQVLQHRRIPTPRFRVLRDHHIPARHGLRYPLMVKPSQQDASLGVRPHSVVQDLAQLTSRVHEALDEFPPPLIIEEFIEGRELHVGVWGNNPPETLPIVEYDFSGLPEDHPSIITYDIKWNPLSEAYHRVHSSCPASLPKSVEKRVREVALHAYVETRCRDYARVDMRLDRENKPYVLEVNPNPDLTAGVSFMEAVEKTGVSFRDALRRIVEMAWARRGAAS